VSVFSRCALLTLAACLGTVGPVHNEEPKRPPDDKNALARFKVATEGDCLLLPVRFKGKTYQFLLDTGSTVNVFDSSLPLGKPIDEGNFGGAAGPARLKRYASPEATVGGLPLKSAKPVAALDFTKVRQVIGHEIHGILGMPFLRSHVIQVDFDRGELLLLKEPGRDCGQGFTLSREEPGILLLRAGVAGYDEQEFILDTGAAGCTLTRESFGAALKRKDLAVFGTTLAESISGTSSVRLARLKQLSAGEFRFREVVVGEAADNRLGLTFCSRFVLTFDCANDTVYLKKGKNFARPDTQDFSGVYALRKEGKTVIDTLGKGSAAEKAGLKAGDVLVKIDGTKANDLSLFRLRQLFGDAGKKLRLTVRRG
jgi:hypothetical protein